MAFCHNFFLLEFVGNQKRDPYTLGWIVMCLVVAFLGV